MCDVECKTCVVLANMHVYPATAVDDDNDVYTACTNAHFQSQLFKAVCLCVCEFVMCTCVCTCDMHDVHDMLTLTMMVVLEENKG